MVLAAGPLGLFDLYVSNPVCAIITWIIHCIHMFTFSVDQDLCPYLSRYRCVLVLLSKFHKDTCLLGTVDRFLLDPCQEC